MYLGHKTISGETIVGTKEGVFKTRIVKRVPLEDLWRYHLIQEMIGVPWKCNPQAEEAEQIIQDVVPHAVSDSLVVPPEPPHSVFKPELDIAMSAESVRWKA